MSDNNNPASLLNQAAEGVRAFNHASLAVDTDWSYPGHAYDALGSLSYLVQMLGQAVQQSTLPVTHTYENGRVVIDGNGDPAAEVGELLLACKDAVAAAAALTAAVQRMHNASASMGLDTRGLPEFEDENA